MTGTDYLTQVHELMVAATDRQDFTLARLDRLFAMSHPAVYWRHDVDYDLDCALRMAVFEADWGIQGTYYLLHPDHENGTQASLETVKLLQALGHHVGAHVDLRAPRDATFNNDELYEACQRQSEWLGIHKGLVSFHQPPESVMWRDLLGFESAQASRWRGRYLADSRGVWRDRPEDLLRDGEPCQLGLHPEWWFWPAETAAKWRLIEAVKP